MITAATVSGPSNSMRSFRASADHRSPRPGGRRKVLVLGTCDPPGVSGSKWVRSGVMAVAAQLVVLARHLPGGLDGLGAARGEEHPVEVTGGELGDLHGQLDRARV